MKKAKCEACEYKGYSMEICRLHSAKGGPCNTKGPGEHQSKAKIGKTVAWGAGVGLAAVVTGMAVAPIIGLQAVLGHVAAKLTMGGVAGAGVNVFRHWKKGEAPPKAVRKRAVMMPIYRKG